MDRLPSELVDYLFAFLSTKSVKNLRLACRSFAEIGEGHLFNGFEFRLYPQLSRLEQLKQLSFHPTIAPRLKCLCYESGIQLEYADYRYWKAQVYQSATNKFSRGITSDGKSQEDYQQFHTALEARFTPDLGERYEEYRRWLDYQAGIMAHSPETAFVFATTLNRCRGLTTIKIVMSEPEITLDALTRHKSTAHRYIAADNIQPAIRIEQRRRNCLAHFISLLKAVYSSATVVTELIAIDLPKAMLNGTKYEADIMNRVFHHLRHLDLKLSEFPHSDWLSRGGETSYFRGRNIAAMTLRKLLNEPKDLQRLALSFPTGREAEFSFDIFDRTNLDRFPRSWVPGLRHLSLANFLCSWEDLNELLKDARNLKSLTLREATMETGSMISILTAVHELKLDDVCIDGTWTVQEDAGEWHSHDEDNFYDCEHYEGAYAVKGLRSKIESYIINGGLCPLPGWTADGHEDRIWELEGDTSWHYIPLTTP
jgi:hypothetical protein